MFLTIVDLNWILDPKNVFSWAMLLIKKATNVSILKQRNSMSVWMLYFSKINHVFGQNSLQGEKENSEDHFWHTSTPMPNLFLPDLSTLTQTQKTDIFNNENLGNLELQEPSVNVPETEGEILQDKIPLPELRVYTRQRYHHSSKDPPINSVQPQLSPPSTDSSENSGNISFPKHST